MFTKVSTLHLKWVQAGVLVSLQNWFWLRSLFHLPAFPVWFSICSCPAHSHLLPVCLHRCLWFLFISLVLIFLGLVSGFSLVLWSLCPLTTGSVTSAFCLDWRIKFCLAFYHWSLTWSACTLDLDSNPQPWHKLSYLITVFSSLLLIHQHFQISKKKKSHWTFFVQCDQLQARTFQKWPVTSLLWPPDTLQLTAVADAFTTQETANDVIVQRSDRTEGWRGARLPYNVTPPHQFTCDKEQKSHITSTDVVWALLSQLCCGQISCLFSYREYV